MLNTLWHGNHKSLVIHVAMLVLQSILLGLHGKYSK